MNECPQADKASFASRAEANVALMGMARRRRRRLVVYRCRCGRWHHGRQYRRATAQWRAA